MKIQVKPLVSYAGHDIENLPAQLVLSRISFPEPEKGQFGMLANFWLNDLHKLYLENPKKRKAFYWESYRLTGSDISKYREASTEIEIQDVIPFASYAKALRVAEGFSDNVRWALQDQPFRKQDYGWGVYLNDEETF